MELKRCPFCGGKADFGVDAGSYGYYSATRWIECQNDKCAVKPRTPSKRLEEWKQGVGSYRVDPDLELSAGWNTRAQLQSECEIKTVLCSDCPPINYPTDRTSCAEDAALDGRRAQETEGDLTGLIDSYVTEAAEFPDRTSQSDRPDMLLITIDELRAMLRTFTDEIRALDQGE